MEKRIKTNAMRILEQHHIDFEAVYYDLGDEEFSGEAVAAALNIPAEQSFKTLTTRCQKSGIVVFVVPVNAELDLKKAAAAISDKKVELLAVKELLSVTGYMRGEVSPVGMKKSYPTYINESAKAFDTIYISGGKKGVNLVVSPAKVADFLHARFADIVS